MPGPSYLAKDRHGGFLFRIAIPKSLRHKFDGKHSIRKSLQTYHRPTALREARKLAVQQEEIFEVVKQKYQEKLADAENEIAFVINKINQAIHLVLFDDAWTAEDLRAGLSTETEPEKDSLAWELYSILQLLGDNLHTSLKTAEEMSLAIEYAEQIEQEQIRDRILKMVRVDYGVEPTEQNTSAPIQSKIVSSHLLSELWREFRASKIRSRRWKDDTKDQKRTIKEYDAHFRDCLDILEHDPMILDWNRQMTRKVVEGIRQLPKSRTKLYPNLKLNEIPDSAEKISATTASLKLDVLKAFFKFLEIEEYTHKHWFANERIERNNSNYPTPTNQDILEWFNLSPSLVNEPWKFWIPRLALYSGARQNEIAQLNVSDISQDPDTGIWFFTIHDGDKNSTKSAAANRNVPLHSQLIDHGFLDYVAGLKQSGESELWPTLREKAGKKGANVSRYWTSLKTKHKVLSNPTDKSGKEKVFHGLRRVILNELTRADVDLVTIQSIVGHEPSLGASKQYLDEPVSLKRKASAIEQLCINNVGWIRE